tara:strand:+ start:629 stop:763 length:135 start_codon:yes stop_codon:yes gene_type:complete
MADSIAALKILDKIYDILIKMDKRLKVVEDSVKKEKNKKQLLND